jgi:hypothetical protein
MTGADDMLDAFALRQIGDSMALDGAVSRAIEVCGSDSMGVRVVTRNMLVAFNRIEDDGAQGGPAGKRRRTAAE